MQSLEGGKGHLSLSAESFARNDVRNSSMEVNKEKNIKKDF